MADTTHLNLPLLSPSQAQKHVTVNEALSRLDGLVQLRLISVTTSTPPAIFDDGDCYGVPVGAVNAWAGQAGKIALALNGGWDFINPVNGFRAIILDQGVAAIFDGSDWRAGALTLTPNGAGLSFASVEEDVVLGAGPTASSSALIPARSILFGVTGIVTAAVTGPASWRIGVAGDDQRFGSGIGTGPGGWLSGPAAPVPYWADTALLLTGEGADFTGGIVRLAVHYATLEIPGTA
ncbi:DUF2793 domain-containing protein [Rhodobacterales bacterium HKCCE3408]|nr:DUF2793 domain-containing protein [Rhodobacterales bacterium HKCCE3408]